MKLMSPIRILLALSALAIFTGTAAAQSSLTSPNTVALNGSFESSAELIVSVSGDPISEVDFGNVNGLANGSPEAGFTASRVGSDNDTGGALYKRTAAITITPRWSGYASATTGKVTVYADGAHETLVRFKQGSAVSDSDSVSTNGASPSTVKAAATNGEAISGYVGFYVPRESASINVLDGTLLDADLIFDLTVEEIE